MHMDSSLRCKLINSPKTHSASKVCVCIPTLEPKELRSNSQPNSQPVCCGASGQPCSTNATWGHPRDMDGSKMSQLITKLTIMSMWRNSLTWLHAQSRDFNVHSLIRQQLQVASCKSQASKLICRSMFMWWNSLTLFELINVATLSVARL